MKAILYFLLPFFLGIQNTSFSGNGTDMNHIQIFEKNALLKDSIKLVFNVIPDEVEHGRRFGENKQKIEAELKYINLGEKEQFLSKTIFYGLESEGDDFVEAYDFNGNKINIEKELDYQYLLTLDLFEKVTLEKDEFKIDTINLSTFYYFKQKGIFKLRFVSKELDIKSNWDTLIVN
ncbi:MAG: hypothetical protein DWQ02_10440 [Bacteroidetes bacterium]|nr:MAG: hypothetical protein DWQ02_10440 [Bacteroidota bacterium]